MWTHPPKKGTKTQNCQSYVFFLENKWTKHTGKTFGKFSSYCFVFCLHLFSLRIIWVVFRQTFEKQSLCSSNWDKNLHHFSGETRTQPISFWNHLENKLLLISINYLYSQNQPQLPTIMVHYVFQAPGFCVDQFPMFANTWDSEPNLPLAAASHPFGCLVGPWFFAFFSDPLFSGLSASR